jgi:hypothetical protein
MKPLILVIGVLFIMYGCNLTPKTREPLLKIRVGIPHRIQLVEYSDIGCQFYSAKVELINTSDSVVRFWTMNCSWVYNWIFDSDSLHLFVGTCTRNFPELYQLEPKGQKEYECIVCVNQYSKGLARGTFRLGFVLINKNELKDDADFMGILALKKRARRDVFWSEPFQFENQSFRDPR